MRAPVHFAALALFTLLALPACDKPDVGERCKLSWNPNADVPPPTPTTALGDYFESGNLACDDLVCILSKASADSKYGKCSGGACGYCSKPCVANRECYTGSTGLICDAVVLDPTFISALEQTNPDLLNRYLGEIRFSNYCVVPREK